MVPADHRDTPAAAQRVPDSGGQFLAIRFDFLAAFRTGAERGPAHDVGPDRFEAVVAQPAGKGRIPATRQGLSRNPDRRRRSPKPRQ